MRMCMLTPYSYSIYPYIYISLYIFKYALNIYILNLFNHYWSCYRLHKGLSKSCHH